MLISIGYILTIGSIIDLRVDSVVPLALHLSNIQYIVLLFKRGYDHFLEVWCVSKNRRIKIERKTSEAAPNNSFRTLSKWIRCSTEYEVRSMVYCFHLSATRAFGMAAPTSKGIYLLRRAYKLLAHQNPRSTYYDARIRVYVQSATATRCVHAGISWTIAGRKREGREKRNQ